MRARVLFVYVELSKVETRQILFILVILITLLIPVALIVNLTYSICAEFTVALH